MPTSKISKRAVDSLKPAERDTYLWDGELHGFGVKCTPSGTKTYLAQYRIGGRKGRTRRVTIGRHGTITPDKARIRAKVILGEVHAGGDPAEARSEARKDISIGDLCALYLAEGCDRKKPSTLTMERGLIRRHIVPLLGNKRIKGLTRADVERFMKAIADGKTATDEKTGFRGRAIVRGGKGIANRTRDLLASILSFAVHRALRPDNPAVGVKKYRSTHQPVFLSSHQLVALGEALMSVEAEGFNLYAIAAIRFLMLTGCRKSEALTLQWDWVDFERQCLRLPDSKTGAKVVPLGAPALELLDALPRIEGNPHTFPSDTGNSHFVGLQKVWKKVRARAGLEGVRLHDLRHSFAGIGASGGDSLYIIGKLLGHKQSRTTERYAHLADDPLRASANRIAQQVAAALNRRSDADVIDLPKKGA